MQVHNPKRLSAWENDFRKLARKLGRVESLFFARDAFLSSFAVYNSLSMML